MDSGPLTPNHMIDLNKAILTITMMFQESLADDNINRVKNDKISAKNFSDKKNEIYKQDVVLRGNEKLVDDDVATTEISTRSVLEEVARFQEEINKVAVNNVKYPTWKQQRLARRHSSPAEKLQRISEDTPNHNNNNPKAGNITEKDNVQKRVTYAENEVTVFQYVEEDLSSLESSVSSHRQLQPSTHIAPADPPKYTDDNTEDYDDTEDKDSIGEVPTLPSVKELASRFTVMKTPGGHTGTKLIQ